MHYPVMTEKHLTERWQVSLKTLQRWRCNGEGPVWYKLFQRVRYHDADILEFEQQSAQHLMEMLGIVRESKPTEPEELTGQGIGTEAEEHYFTSREIAEATSLPRHFFCDQAERKRKRVPHLMLVGNLRFSLPAIFAWEVANSVRGKAVAVAAEKIESPANPSEPAKRWYEIVREQDTAQPY